MQFTASCISTYLPGRQELHSELLCPNAYLPGTQDSQEEDELPENRPLVQTSQYPVPEVNAAVPAVHEVQTAFPVPLAYVPDGHATS